MELSSFFKTELELELELKIFFKAELELELELKIFFKTELELELELTAGIGIELKNLSNSTSIPPRFHIHSFVLGVIFSWS